MSKTKKKPRPVWTYRAFCRNVRKEKQEQDKRLKKKAVAA